MDAPISTAYNSSTRVDDIPAWWQKQLFEPHKFAAQKTCRSHLVFYDGYPSPTSDLILLESAIAVQVLVTSHNSQEVQQLVARREEGVHVEADGGAQAVVKECGSEGSTNTSTYHCDLWRLRGGRSQGGSLIPAGDGKQARSEDEDRITCRHSDNTRRGGQFVSASADAAIAGRLQSERAGVASGPVPVLYLRFSADTFEFQFAIPQLHQTHVPLYCRRTAENTLQTNTAPPASFWKAAT